MHTFADERRRTSSAFLRIAWHRNKAACDDDDDECFRDDPFGTIICGELLHRIWSVVQNRFFIDRKTVERFAEPS